MSGYSFKFTFEDGSEAIAHYGVKGMKWKQHVKAFDPQYLLSLGVEIPKKLNEGFDAAGQAVEDFRNWEGPEGLPENPLHTLAETTKEKEESGESDAARKRLEKRYSYAGVNERASSRANSILGW